MPKLTADILRQLLDYDPGTGIFIWRERPPVDGHIARWNGKWAGKEAGTPHCKGYVGISLVGGRYLAHRLAWLHVTGEWPKVLIDHINGDRSDNRIANLREASHAENVRYQTLHKDNVSGFKGVSWHKGGRKWMARLTLHDRNVYLGLYSTREEAFEAYKAGAIKHFGDFAKVA